MNKSSSPGNNTDKQRKNKSNILMKTQTYRRLFQLIFLGIFILLLVLAIMPFAVTKPIDIFFHLDPLIGLTTALYIRSVEVWMVGGIVTLVLTALFGRIFCGWFCPMGTVIDLCDRFIFRKKKDIGVSPMRYIKYYLLAGLLVAAIFNEQLTYFFDPFGILTRFFALVIAPPIYSALKWLSVQGWVYDIAPRFSQTPLLPETAPYYSMTPLFAGVFTAVILLGFVSRRFWCRNICPLGALLGITAKFGFLRRKVTNEGCINCKRCISDCKMGAILDDPKQYQSTECIYCYNCVEVCKPMVSAININIETEGYQNTVDIPRRQALGAMGIGLVWAVSGKANIDQKNSVDSSTRQANPGLIRPPNSVNETEFLSRCTRCSLCMKVCPTGGLQPSLNEAGLDGFMTPILIPRVGYCSDFCDLCGKVCPTNAIMPFNAEDKANLPIGKAFVDKNTCIVWADGGECLVCDEMCTYKAIKHDNVTGGPIVNANKCVGCGQCENKCPVQPTAAIRVRALGAGIPVKTKSEEAGQDQNEDNSSPYK